jgi:hypothetical protein
MKKSFFICLILNFCVIPLIAQIQDANSPNKEKLMELGKKNCINKDSIRYFHGKRFDKATVEVNKKEFDNIVRTSIRILNNKAFEAITDTEHRAIIRATNTILVQNFAESRYEELKNLVFANNYPLKMMAAYKWAYSSGMGWAFLELGIDLYGDMGKINCFTIRN